MRWCPGDGRPRLADPHDYITATITRPYHTRHDTPGGAKLITDGLYDRMPASADLLNCISTRSTPHLRLISTQQCLYRSYHLGEAV